MGKRWLVPLGLATAALIAAGCGSTSTTSGSGSGSGGSGGSGGTQTGTASSSNTVKSGKIGGATVLTNAQGRTLYWFVIDTPTQSKCTDATCMKFWVPVKGPVQAGAGVTGSFTTITRPDGSKQASWNGHPLYTYIGDTKAGESTGNNVNIDGGIWHEVTLSGSSGGSGGGSGGGGGGGGYGY